MANQLSSSQVGFTPSCTRLASRPAGSIQVTGSDLWFEVNGDDKPSGYHDHFFCNWLNDICNSGYLQTKHINTIFFAIGSM